MRLLLTALPLFCAAASPSNARPAPNVDVSKIYGRIQFVDAFPDYKVEVVTAFPDLRVQKVQAFPDAAGKWEIVTAFPDYKIQLVRAFADFQIEYVRLYHRQPPDNFDKGTVDEGSPIAYLLKKLVMRSHRTAVRMATLVLAYEKLHKETREITEASHNMAAKVLQNLALGLGDESG